MCKELISDLDTTENIMIALAEARQRKGTPLNCIIYYNLFWWFAKCIYDLLQWAIRRDRRGD